MCAYSFLFPTEQYTRYNISNVTHQVISVDSNLVLHSKCILTLVISKNNTCCMEKGHRGISVPGSHFSTNIPVIFYFKNNNKD